MSGLPDYRGNLLTWCRETKPWCRETLHYAESQKAQIMWVRDTLASMVTRLSPLMDDGKDGAIIVGWHFSKSVPLPVYCIDAGWGEVVLRDNFHDFNVTVRSKVGPLDVDLSGLLGDPHYLFFQGMAAYTEAPYVRGSNEERFSFVTRRRYETWTALFLLAREGFRLLAHGGGPA